MNVMQQAGCVLAVQWLNAKHAVTSRWRDERGEGVISMAIAVLIIALLGAALWVVFDRVVDNAGDTIEDQVESIG